MPVYCVKNVVKFGPVTPELTGLICESEDNNTGVMKANLYYVHSLHVRQMLVRFCFDTVC